MDIISSVILGVVQGITEFLPVSSSGHLILTHAFLDLRMDEGTALAFDVMLHLATAGAVIVYFFDEIYVLAQTVMRKLGRLPVNEKDLLVVKAIAIGTIPAVVVGMLLESIIAEFFRQPILVAVTLILGSILFIYAEYVYENSFHTGTIDIKTGFKIGLFQVLALIPGVSRSGATIAGGMILGLTRSEAARFSFLLALPVILGAGGKEVIQLITSPAPVVWSIIIAGAIAAFAIGLSAIHFLITFVRKHTLWPFIWYRIVLAAFIIFVTFFGTTS